MEAWPKTLESRLILRFLKNNMRAMESVLNILIPIAMGAVVIVLALGLFNMFKRDAASPSRSNRLMRLRVLLQFVAVGLIMLLFYLGSQ